MDAADIEALGKVIAKELRRVDNEDPLLNTEDVAALINCEPRSVTEHFARSPTFPKAIYLSVAAGKKARPKWRRSSILQWIARHESPPPTARKPGRPRNQVDD